MTEAPTLPNKPLVLHATFPFRLDGALVSFSSFDVNVVGGLTYAVRHFRANLAIQGITAIPTFGFDKHHQIAVSDSFGCVIFHETPVGHVNDSIDQDIARVLEYAMKVAHFNSEGRAVMFIEINTTCMPTSVSGLRLMDIDIGVITMHNRTLLKGYSKLALDLTASSAHESTSTSTPTQTSVPTVLEYNALQLPSRHLTPKEFVELDAYHATELKALTDRYSDALVSACANIGKKSEPVSTHVTNITYLLKNMAVALEPERVKALLSLGFSVEPIDNVMEADTMNSISFPTKEGCALYMVTSPAFL